MPFLNQPQTLHHLNYWARAIVLESHCNQERIEAYGAAFLEILVGFLDHCALLYHRIFLQAHLLELLLARRFLQHDRQWWPLLLSRA